MANRISLLKSEVVGATPTASAMASGELAVNFADKKIFGKHPGSGAVVQVAASPTHSHAISDVNGLQSALYTAPLYNLSTLPYNGTDGNFALITNGSSTSGPTMAYYYNGHWYRTLDNSQIWTPNEISTVFWYDPSDASTINATGSIVNQVSDKSGNGYDLTPVAGLNSPLIGTRSLNGLNVLEWTNDNCVENNSFAHDQATTPLYIALIIYSDGIDTQDFIWSGAKTTETGKRLSFRTSTVWQILGGNGSANVNFTGPTLLSNQQPYIALTKLNSSNSEIRVDGGTQSATGGNIGTNAFDNYFALGHNESEGSDLDGYIGEVIAFTDGAEQERAEGYLAWKWGLVANLPAGHPYKTSAP